MPEKEFIPEIDRMQASYIQHREIKQSKVKSSVVRTLIKIYIKPVNSIGSYKRYTNLLSGFFADIR